MDIDGCNKNSALAEVLSVLLWKTKYNGGVVGNSPKISSKGCRFNCLDQIAGRLFGNLGVG